MLIPLVMTLREQGLSLLEITVAWTLTLVILVSALAMLAALRRSYLKSEMAADAAGRVRIAIDNLTHDLRLAGLGVDPDGVSARPDEAIEGAWAGAIAARGDLDAGDPAQRDDPERWIAGVFPSVATGNDEVFAYALRRESGSGGSDLTLDADLFSSVLVTTPSGTVVAARDGVVETLRLPRVMAAGGGSAGRGCILYRASVANNATLWGSGNGVTWQPLTDGISTLAFRYFDETGAEIAPPGGDETGAAARAAIASVEVRVVALERQPDSLWTDPADPDVATAHYRKAEDRVRIALRNARPLTHPDRLPGPPEPVP